MAGEKLIFLSQSLLQKTIKTKRPFLLAAAILDVAAE